MPAAGGAVRLSKGVNGVKIGCPAYIYNTNETPLPAGHRYFFNFLEKNRVLADIRPLRPQVDVLMLPLHWRMGYNSRPIQKQGTMVSQVFKAGAESEVSP